MYASYMQKEQVVIVEFQREFPRGVLVTFNFYYSCTGKKVSTIPTVSLGPHTVKAKFPGKMIHVVLIIVNLVHSVIRLYTCCLLQNKLMGTQVKQPCIVCQVKIHYGH